MKYQVVLLIFSPGNAFVLLSPPSQRHLGLRLARRELENFARELCDEPLAFAFRVCLDLNPPVRHGVVREGGEDRKGRGQQAVPKPH